MKHDFYNPQPLALDPRELARDSRDAKCTKPIEEAPTRAKAHEALDYLGSAHQLLDELHCTLLGGGAEVKDAANTPVNCIDDAVRLICHRSACLVGDLKTILSRL